jgi:mannitol/fructose-specific phosphotransferase system IIA component (Ntr-type)
MSGHSHRRTVRTLFPDDVIVLTLKASQRDAAIAELLNGIVIGGHVDLSRERAVLDAILEREKVASTGIGNEFALPHVKTKFAHRFAVAVGLAPQGIDFGARDQRPARLVLLAVCPPSATQEHLSLMRGIASLAKSEGSADRLLQARDKRSLADLLDSIPLDDLGK